MIRHPCNPTVQTAIVCLADGDEIRAALTILPVLAFLPMWVWLILAGIAFIAGFPLWIRFVDWIYSRKGGTCK